MYYIRSDLGQIFEHFDLKLINHKKTKDAKSYAIENMNLFFIYFIKKSSENKADGMNF